MKRKLFYLLFITFTFFNLLDLVTYFFVAEYESNPLAIEHGWIFLLLVKVIVVIAFYLYYRYYDFSNHYVVFFLCSMLVILTWVFFYYGALRNMIMMIHGELIQMSCDRLLYDSTFYYQTVLTFNYIIPYILSIISFIVYKCSVTDDN